MNPQNPSLFEPGGIPGLNPAQRPQLRAPIEEPPEMEKVQPDFPEYGHIMAIGIIALTFIIFGLVLWKRKKDRK
jgi:hypothetical protein